MLNKSYTETLNWLFNQFPAYHKIGIKAYKPDVSNCLILCELFGNPQNKLKFIHVAGTNGKGSTTSMLASILQESGKKVGLFTSPHIVDFRERIRVNGDVISEIEVIDFCSKIKSFNLNFEPSFFEISWVMALQFFQSQMCDICVIETGLGGRLDATNLITPILSIITNIGLEHTNFLGNTLEKIAFEKAGIIKKNIPVIIGETLPQTKPVFNELAKKNNSKIFYAENNTLELPPSFPLLGEYQKRNYKIIQSAIDILKDLEINILKSDIELGLKNLSKNTGFRGRMQIVSDNPLTIFDVSHNFDGIKATLESIEKINKGKLFILYGTSSDKDLDSIFSILPKNATYYFTEFSNERSATIDQLKEFTEKNKLSSLFFASPNTALNEIQIIANKEDTILVFGSFFLISDFF